MSRGQDVHVRDEAAATKILQLAGHCKISAKARLKFKRLKFKRLKFKKSVARDHLRPCAVLLHFNLYLYFLVYLTNELNSRLRQRKILLTNISLPTLRYTKPFT